MLPPLTVEQIARQAGQYEFDPQVPLRYWLRSAGLLVKEARIYEQEGNDQQAYLLLFRHAQLVLINLTAHPDAQDPKNKQGLAAAKKEVQASLNKLEILKPRIRRLYDRYQELQQRSQSDKHAADTTTTSMEDNNTATASFSDLDATVRSATTVQDPALAGRPEALQAAENRDFAVRLAQSEFRRRAFARGDARRSPYASSVASISTTNTTNTTATNTAKMEGDVLARRLQEVRSMLSSGHSKSTTTTTTTTSTSSTSKSRSPTLMPLEQHLSGYRYPSIPRQSYQHHHTRSHSPIRPPKVEQAPPVPGKAPAIPAKIPDPDITSSSTTASTTSLLPPLPSKVPPLPPRTGSATSSPSRTPTHSRSNTRTLISSPPKLPSKQPPTPGEDKDVLHPSTFTFKPSSYLENGTPLRTIFISPDLRTEFLSLAGPNTTSNLETCGILAGTLISNAFFISRLIIPEQESTPDTCEMLNEAAIFEYCEAEDLMVLGWIHTHPSQTCFMSSRDLHTQSGYQVMLSESIAIVCAPSHEPSWGVFRLTDPPGLKSVLNCTRPGLFHPHDETNIYTDALRPGHVFEAKGLDFETVDLRPTRK
ncbi:STAM-binding protein [Nannizzia gypsea CBS 118893]|uniref:STAM-binding protein n=1 Tax=Arthroderma gypseum (strain ATCC MYA-4604 / CBS 118893) TaxID=535722 RepID=E4V0B1_ARTGP|nr:STAM-binding protein [Nannizzia gypsea CBS 118893]EFR03048.1 STAM-binding protein [Nannizzia gypsea CBS 118893]